MASVWLGFARPIGLHGGGLAAPDELGAAAAEVAPAAERVLAGRAVAIGVPAFHRMNAPAIADAAAGDRHRLGQRRTLRGRKHRLGDRQVEPQLGQPQAKGVDRLELGDLRIAIGLGHARRNGCDEVASCETASISWSSRPVTWARGPAKGQHAAAAPRNENAPPMLVARAGRISTLSRDQLTFSA